MAIAYKQNVKFAGDPRFATVQDPTGSALDKVKALEGYYFYYNELGQDFGYGRAEEGHNVRQVGLIAQELMAVEPALVVPMDWLGEDEEYYAIDYVALYALILDAVNELNARADAAKIQLGMSVESYPAKYNGPMPQLTSYEFTSITASPVEGAEGTTVTWTLTGNNIPEGLVVPFRFDGNFNFNDITIPTQDEQSTGVFMLEDTEENAEDIANEGQISGTFLMSGNSATVKLHYVSDGLLEGPETITMSLKANDSRGNALPALSQTATIVDA